MKRIAWASIPVVVFLVGAACARFTQAAQEPHPHDKAYAACAKACAECMNSCASCQHHCAHLVSEGEKDHTKTMVLCNDCADICSTAAKLTSRHSPFSALICEACAKSCDQCGEACAKFPQDEHMSECSKACRECAAACREMIQHVSK